jgi:lipopolysaccharide biosynthesis protein
LHSKKSPHTDFGDEWRQYLFRGCVGDAATVAGVLSRFAADPKLAVVFPDTFSKIAPFTRVEFNTEHIDSFLKRLNSNWRYQRTAFPAGSMCWIRTEAFLPLLRKMPTLDEIEAEAGQIDKTWAHAMERCLTLIPKLSGYAFSSYPVRGDAQ